MARRYYSLRVNEQAQILKSYLRVTTGGQTVDEIRPRAQASLTLSSLAASENTEASEEQ